MALQLMAPVLNRRRKQDLRRKRLKNVSLVVIPDLRDPERRARFEPLATDDLDVATAKAAGFMREYMPGKFYHPFTDDQLTMIRDALQCAKYGGKQADAAPRFGGKTSLIEGLIIYCILYGLLGFPVILAATAKHGDRIVANIKFEFANNDDLLADFPEVCAPIVALEGRPQRAISQTAKRKGQPDSAAKPTLMKWGRDEAVFPTVDGSKASGAVMMAFGIDGAIRGVRYLNRRPDFVLIDDPETRESAKSAAQVADRLQAIDRDVSGLAGPGKRIAQIALVTIQECDCVADDLTDRQKRPAWQGKRFKLVKVFPKTETADDGKKLWQEYMRQRHEDQQKGDRWARGAHAFYLERRAEMDEGAEVGDPYRFVGETLPDGTQVEVSTLQSYYNFVADNGQAAADSELQNSPTAKGGAEESGINPLIVQSRINAFARRQVPADCTVLTAYIDLGKYGCHWTVEGWRPGATGFVIDYGVAEVFNMGTAVNSQVVDAALVNTLRNWKETMENDQFKRDNEPLKFDMVLVDSSDFTDAAYAFCKESGPPFYPAKGFGQGRFYPGITNHAKGHVAGQHWYTQIQPNGVKLVGLEADHWKLTLHNFFMTATFDKEQNFKDSAISLFSPGNDKRCHQTFAHHICAEIWTEDFVPDKGRKVGFKMKSHNNHWLDSTAGAMAAAFMCGIRIVGEAKPQGPRRTLQELAANARRIA